MSLAPCYCGSTKPTYWINDGHGIPLCKVCDDCRDAKLKRYRSDILTPYETDGEPIEPDYNRVRLTPRNDW
jgi:hypothetical protein